MSNKEFKNRLGKFILENHEGSEIEDIQFDEDGKNVAWFRGMLFVGRLKSDVVDIKCNGRNHTYMFELLPSGIGVPVHA